MGPLAFANERSLDGSWSGFNLPLLMSLSAFLPELESPRTDHRLLLLNADLRREVAQMHWKFTSVGGLGHFQ